MIYFIEAEGAGLIKIGFTTINPGVRLIQLQIGSPVKLVGLALMAGNKRRERAIHLRYRQDQSHGEWFRASPYIRAYIKAKSGPWEYAISDRYLMPAERRARAEAKAAKLAEHRKVVKDLDEGKRIDYPAIYAEPKPKPEPKQPAKPPSRFPWNSADLMALRAQKRAKG